MWTDEIATYLRGENITGVGQSVFSTNIPSGVNTAVMVAQDYRGVSVDPELPGYHRGRVQLVARAKTSSQAEDLATRASKAMAVVETEMGSIYVKFLRPQHLPVPYPRSNGDYYEASVNFDICFLSDMA